MDPAGISRLGSAVTGLLREIHVDRGATVVRGDLIARVDSSVERASRNVLELRATNTSQIDAARARLGYIVSKRDRTEKLMQRGITSEEVLAEIEAEVIAARSLLRQSEMEQELARLEHGRAEAIIALRDIRSPVDGVISETADGSGRVRASRRARGHGGATRPAARGNLFAGQVVSATRTGRHRNDLSRTADRRPVRSACRSR